VRGSERPRPVLGLSRPGAEACVTRLTLAV
jgi:hypothetical protein